MSSPTLTDFPRLIKEAAETFRSECAAWTQFRWEGSDLKVRLQAPDIMQQFVGDVEFGKDPEGLLFYNNAASDFAMRDHDFDYVKHGNGPWITVVLTFYEADDRKAIARFLARVDTRKYPIPGASVARGRGKWSKFPAATAQTTAVRAEGRDRLYLQFPALRKYVYFQTSSTQAVEEKPGVVIFKDYNMLTDTVHSKPVVADYSDDRIVFHPDGDKKTVVALFIPNDPIPVGKMPSKGPATTWRVFDPDTVARGAAALDAHAKAGAHQT